MTVNPGPLCRLLVIVATAALFACAAPGTNVVQREPGIDQNNQNQNSDFNALKKETTVEIEALKKETATQIEALKSLEERVTSNGAALKSLKKELDSIKKAGFPEKALRKVAPPLKMSRKSKPINTKPALLYQEARGYMMQESYGKAAKLFRAYLKQYPETQLSDNALYWLGECRYSTGEFAEAAETFKEVANLYPKGDKVSDALLKAAYSYLSLDDSDRAHYYLKLVVKQYPFTPAGEKAAVKLKEFQ